MGDAGGWRRTELQEFVIRNQSVAIEVLFFEEACMGRRLALGMFLLLIFTAGSVYAGDGFLKAGLIIKPKDDLSASDRYLIDFGSDYQVGYMVGIGWEIATAYYSQDFGGTTLRTVPINTFFNVKIMPPSEGIRPFGKVGVGALTTILNIDNNTDHSTDAAIHFSGGVELAKFVVELQGQKRFKSNSDFTWIVLAGFVF